MHLPASCATSCTMPTADESNHKAVSMLHPYRSTACVVYATLHCLIPPPPKKHFPSKTGDINPQSSHWNNGKMKITCNSAYVWTETFNFTFAGHATIVYFYLCSNFQEITMQNAKYECISRLFLPIILDYTLILARKNQYSCLHTLNFYCY